MVQDNNQLIDIYDIWYEPWVLSDRYYFLFLGIIFLIVIFCIARRCRRYRLRKPTIKVAEQIAQEIRALQECRIYTQQDSKDCYFKLSLLLKQYLAFRYDQKFMNLTDTQIIEQAAIYMSQDDLDKVRKLLEGMLFIKFEHQVAADAKLQEDIRLLEDVMQSMASTDQIKGS
jgi:hypothetical protein